MAFLSEIAPFQDEQKYDNFSHSASTCFDGNGKGYETKQEQIHLQFTTAFIADKRLS